MENKSISNRKTILFVPKIHFIIYLITVCLGVLLSLLIVGLGFKYDNSVINYFLSLTASLVVTPIFAYFIDVANSRIQKTALKEKRGILLNPLVNNTVAALARTCIIRNYVEFQNKEITFDNIEECINILLDKYIDLIGKLCYQRNDIKLINECFNIKQWEVYGLREIEKQLKTFLDNEVALVSEGILTTSDYLMLHRLYDAVTNARLPYLSQEQDKNISKATVDWPTMPLSEIDISNLHSSFKFFIFILKDIVSNFNEFNVIKELRLNPHYTNNKE